MSRVQEHPTSALAAISNAMVALHKEQFGRGPTTARSHFAGPDALLCVLEEALLPAERKLVEMGEHQRVRESRLAFQVATTEEFVGVVERIVGRRVRAFASSVDVVRDVVFESFVFDADADASRDGDARLTDGAGRQSDSG